jgi:hypothetical protein
MDQEYYLDEYEPFPVLDESGFEDDFFSYNPDNDPNGSIGIGLADSAFFRARREKLPIELWMIEHRMNYNYRNHQQVS